MKAGTLRLQICNDNFSCKKSELHNEYRMNKEFREPRHVEYGFDSLFGNTYYNITTYESNQISQLNSSSHSGKIISSSLIRA